MTFLVILIVFVLIIVIAVLVNKSLNSKKEKGVIKYDLEKANQTEDYKKDSQAVVISCYFNPQESPYRLKAFNAFYEKIKHLDHRIIECVIGDAEPELPQNENIKRIYTKSLLWHKETLLNKIIAELPLQYKYIFWLDADVLFENKNWLVEGVQELQKYKVIQPFEYGVHLERDQRAFYGNPEEINNQIKKKISAGKDVMNIRVWKSFCSTYGEEPTKEFTNYDLHGHVGFAWGARREILEKVPLYDKALIGGADHIIAHAAVGQIPHKCIKKAFTENLSEVIEWSEKFQQAVGTENNVGFVKGTLLHIWHGELYKRDYLNRIKVNAGKIKKIQRRDENGLYETDDDSFVQDYFLSREVNDDDESDFAYSTYENNDSSQSDNSTTSANNDYFQSETVDFAGAGAGGSWDDSSVSTAEASIGADLSSYEGSSFS